MLAKKNRIDKKLFAEVMKRGRFFNTPLFSGKLLLISNSKTRISFVVSKKVLKKAVDRNSLRRKCYIAAEDFIEALPRGSIIIFFARPAAITGSIVEILKDLRTLIKTNKKNSE